MKAASCRPAPGPAPAGLIGTQGAPPADSLPVPLPGPGHDGQVATQTSAQGHCLSRYPASPEISRPAVNQPQPEHRWAPARWRLYTRAQRALTTARGGLVRGAVTTRLSRDFQLLLGGSTVSMLGSRITAVSYPLLVLAVTGSPLAAGWSTFAVIAPSALIYLPAGVLVDRWDPRRVMFASELGRFAAVGIIIALIVIGNHNLVILVFAAATEQTLEVFSALAERRFSLSLVDRDQATSALVRSETRTHLVVMLGRPIGAVLFGIAWVMPFAVDAVTFLGSLWALFHIRNGRPAERRTVQHMVCEFRSALVQIASRMAATASFRGKHERVTQQPAERAMVGEIGEVFRWLRAHPFALVGLCLTTGTTFVSQALIMVFIAEVHGQRFSPIKIGIVLAASGVGGVIGSAVASSLFNWADYKLLQGQLVVWSITFGCLAFFGSGSYWAIAAAMIFLGFAGALGNIAIDTFLALYAGPKLGRVLSVDRLTSFCALALGPALGGALFANFGAQFAVRVLFAMTLFLVAGTLVITIVYYLRHRRPDVPGFTGPSALSTGPWALVNPAVLSAWLKSAYFVFRMIRAVAWGPAYLLSQQELQEAKRMLAGNRSAREAARTVSEARS